jgi:hypothetical protein
MDTVLLRFRGRVVTHADAAFIRRFIADNPSLSRHALSRRLCEIWNWRQPNGHLRDMVCRSLMLALHRAGHIELPPVRWVHVNPLANRRAPQPVQVDRSPIEMPFASLGPLDLLQVRQTPHEGLCNALLQEHHYLGYTQPVGEHLKFLVQTRNDNRPVACLAWSSAPRHIGARDRFIGWTKEHRQHNLHLLAYNTRFLVLPWVRVPHLASHILGRMVRELSSHWQALYGHGVYYAETFVDRSRFAGTCYRAANWLSLGQTTGRGKNDKTHQANRTIKDVLGYPLVRDFRQKLGVTP